MKWDYCECRRGQSLETRRAAPQGKSPRFAGHEVETAVTCMNVCPSVLKGVFGLTRGCALGLRGARSRRLRRYTVEDDCGTDSSLSAPQHGHATAQRRGGGAVGSTCQQDRKKDGRSQTPAGPHRAGGAAASPTAPAARPGAPWSRRPPHGPTHARRHSRFNGLSVICLSLGINRRSCVV